MKKDIYIIKNKINNKVYIGQSVNSAERFVKHINDALHRPNNQVIHKAMVKYGISNFYYEILESQIENYNEREQYWINYYNSIVPNGYNVAIGGSGSGSGIYNSQASIKSQELLDAIIEEIVANEQSFAKIGKKYGVSQGVISEINLGNKYYNAELNYPLRPEKRYSQDLIKQLAYALKYEMDKTLEDIAKEYNIDRGQLSLINQGKIYKQDWLEYPIRKGKNTSKVADFAKEIQDLLLNTKIPQKDIAKQFNISVNTVSYINLGKSYRDNNLDYPLRKNYQANRNSTKCFSPDMLKQICDDLQYTTISMRDLATKYECTITTIMNINTGSINKYRNNELKYPLRKK